MADETTKPAAEAPAAETAIAEAPPTAVEKKEERLAANRQASQDGLTAVDELAKLDQTSMMPFNPTDFNGAFKLAGFLSESGVVPDDLKGNAGAVLSVMARGAQVGLHWSVAVQEAYVVYGRVGWPAAIIAALVDTSPAFEYFEIVEATNETCTVEAKKHRWKEPRRHTVTMEDAQRAGFLDGKHSEQWTLRPFYMLQAMARREAGRMWDPGRLAGVYDVDELKAMKQRRSAELPAKTATSSLTAFGGEAPALPAAAAEISAQPAAQPATAAKPADPPAADPKPAEPEPEVPDVCGLAPDQVERIRGVLSQTPVVQETSLEARLGGMSLGSLRGNPGEKPQELYTRVLEIVRALKKKAK